MASILQNRQLTSALAYSQELDEIKNNVLIIVPSL